MSRRGRITSKSTPVSGAAQTAQMYNQTTTITRVPKTTVALDENQNLIVTDSTLGGKNDQLTFLADTADNQFIISDLTSMVETSIATATGSGTHQVVVPFSAVTGTSVNINTLDGDDTISIISGAMPVTVDAGTGTDTINVLATDPLVPVIIASSPGGDAVNVGADDISIAAVTFPVSQAIGALTIGAGGVAMLPVVAPGALPTVLVVTSLDIAGAGRLDLANNDLVVDYADASPIGGWNGSAYDGIAGLIQSGRKDGSWTGGGIVTGMTDAAADNPIATLGVAEASIAAAGITDAQTALFDGQTVDATSVLVKYTYTGDMNLDGTITGDDYFDIDSGFAAQTVGYASGDLDYNGRIDADDYFLIDANYNKDKPAPPPADASAVLRSSSPVAFEVRSRFMPVIAPSDPADLTEGLL